MATKIPPFAGGRPSGEQLKDTRSFNVNLGEWLTGIKTKTFFYGNTADTAENFILWTSNFSAEDESGTPGLIPQVGTEELVVEQDFDYVIEADRLIGGDTVFVTDFSYNEVGAATANFFAIVKIRKFNGATETDLLTMTGITHSSISDSTYEDTLSGNITKTSFKAGDILRLTIELWGKSTTNDGTLEINWGKATNTLEIPFINLDEY